MNYKPFFFFLLGMLMVDLPSSVSAQDNLPKTVAESSNWESTSTSAEVVEFIDQCAEQAEHVSKFVFGKTVEGREMVAVSVASPAYEIGKQDDRARVLVIGNIHSGECAGKEGLLMMIRELAADQNHRWLKNCVLIIAPNYNADANDRVGKKNRPGQLGPVNGMGRRENAQDLDLNRDFSKLESPEARNLIKLIDEVNPHLFIDCHTTNGSKHQYALTYDVPHNPATAAPIRDFLRDKMMPEITDRCLKNGFKSFYYGNFNKEHTAWTTYGYEPRYSTEYVGLRGRLAILSEAYSYISYQERIAVSKSFVTNCIDYIHENAAAVDSLLKSVDQELIRAATNSPERIQVSLAAKPVAFKEKFALKGFKDDQPHDYQCDFVGDYASTNSTSLPFAYVIPKDHVRVVERLRMHGVNIQMLKEDTELNVEVHKIKELNRAKRAFQKHKMVQATSQRDARKETISAGSYIVSTGQPLGRFVAYMLECDSDDGFIFWNFFDQHIAVDRDYPVLRIPAPTKLNTAPIVGPGKVALTLEMIDGPNELDVETSRPIWKGNQLIGESWGRKMLMNPANMAFEGRLEPDFDKAALLELLKSENFEEKTADAIVNSKPKVSADKSSFVFNRSGHCIYYVPKNKSIKILGTPESTVELVNPTEDQSRIAYHNSKGLNILKLADGSVATFSPDDPENELLGKLDWVYQEELYGRGNYKGYWLSPDSNKVAFFKLDESGVKKFTITDHIPFRGTDEYMSYPKAGDPNPTIKVAVASIDDPSSTVWVDLSNYGDEEILVSGVTWSPDSSKLFLQIQDREQTWLDLVTVDSSGNNPKRLFRDKTNAWIESPGDPMWTNDGSFLWLSSRSGYKSLYMYSADGNKVEPLVSGNWEIRSLLEFDDKNDVIYFSAAKESPYNLDAYRLDIASRKVTRITKRDGTHTVNFSKDLAYFIDSVSSANSPERHYLYAADGTELRELNASVKDDLDYIDLAEPEFLTVESGSDQPLDAMLIKPPNFDPSKKYPVLIYIYAGPQSPRVRNRWGGKFYLWHQLLAQQGYVVWSCDNQSASYRSAAGAWPIHRNLGENELADIERGVDWLKKQTWVDADRLGIWGWSYGGYMTAYAMTHSKNFKMGISGAPVTDWRNYDTIYTERLMGTPQNNPEGYKKSSVLESAANLHGKMLLIHGTIDDNVHLSNSMQLIYKLQKSGKQFDFMVYPKNRHSVRDPEQAAHMRRLMYEYVIENL